MGRTESRWLDRYKRIRSGMKLNSCWIVESHKRLLLRLELPLGSTKGQRYYLTSSLKEAVYIKTQNLRWRRLLLADGNSPWNWKIYRQLFECRATRLTQNSHALFHQLTTSDMAVWSNRFLSRNVISGQAERWFTMGRSEKWIGRAEDRPQRRKLGEYYVHQFLLREKYL